MMSSAIPARLQFQCGHAALVTLPRVKGETATQRTERVAREKSAALVRQCDFCAPALNGNGASHAIVVESIPSDSIESLAVVVSAEPESEPVSEAPATNGHVHVEPEAVEPEAPVTPIEVEVIAEAVTEPEIAEPEAEVVAIAPVQAVARRAPRKPRATPAVTKGYRFLVEYQLERIVQAVDIREALRQAGALGATQVTAITRED